MTELFVSTQWNYTLGGRAFSVNAETVIMTWVAAGIILCLRQPEAQVPEVWRLSETNRPIPLLFMPPMRALRRSTDYSLRLF